MDKPQISEQGEKAKKLGPASGRFGSWAWMDVKLKPKDFDDSAECWRDEGRRAWTAESPAGQAWLVAGAVVCAGLTAGWVGWVVWLVVGKG